MTGSNDEVYSVLIQWETIPPFVSWLTLQPTINKLQLSSRLVRKKILLNLLNNTQAYFYSFWSSFHWLWPVQLQITITFFYSLLLILYDTESLKQPA